MNFGIQELVIVLVIVLLVFGSTRLPKLARAIGQASGELKKGMQEGAPDSDDKKNAANGDGASSKQD